MRSRVFIIAIALGVTTFSIGCSTKPPAHSGDAARTTAHAVDVPRGSRVFADPGDRRRIVYVFDSTMAMRGKIGIAKTELTHAIRGLREDQSFAVVVYTKDGSVRSMSQSLMAATIENKRRAWAFLEEGTTDGDSYPIPALRMAFRMKPDLVYFFSADGYGGDKLFAPVGEVIARLNSDRKVKVHTILFDAEGGRFETKAALRKIAADNGGKFRDWHESEDIDRDR